MAVSYTVLLCIPIDIWVPAALIHVAHWLHDVVIVLCAFWLSCCCATYYGYTFALNLMQSVM